MRIFVLALLAATSLLVAAQVQAACPNAQTSVTIPLSGTVPVTVYDQACNALAGPFSVYNGTTTAFPVITATTSPAVSNVAGLLQFSANAAPSGLKGTFDVCFTPASQCTLVTYVIGSPVSSISVGDTNP